MIVTPRFVYLHLHKSGGTFVSEGLIRYVPSARFVGYHLPATCIPPEVRDLPRLGFVRNPWSYYVSWFNFQRERPQPNHLFRCVSRNGGLDFADTIRRLIGLESDPQLLHEVLAGLPEHFTNRGLNLPRASLAPIRGSGLGFYSYLYRYMFGANSDCIFVGRTETLRTSLFTFFERIGFEPGAEFRTYIESAAPRNASRRDDYRRYYDDTLRELVQERDGGLIRAHGYDFAATDVSAQPPDQGFPAVPRGVPKDLG